VLCNCVPAKRSHHFSSVGLFKWHVAQFSVERGYCEAPIASNWSSHIVRACVLGSSATSSTACCTATTPPIVMTPLWALVMETLTRTSRMHPATAPSARGQSEPLHPLVRATPVLHSDGITVSQPAIATAVLTHCHVN